MARLSIEEYNDLVARRGRQDKPKKASKYHNEPTIVDGIRFASKAEAKRYGELKLIEKSGLIKDLRLQPEYCFPCGVKYRGDFYYTINGKEVVEDVKGMKTNVFKMKEKMFKHHFPDMDFRLVT